MFSTSLFIFNFICKCCKFLSFHIIYVFVVSFPSFQSYLSSLHALLRVHKTFSCNLYLCIHHAYFPYHQMSISYHIYLLLLWMMFQDHFYIHLFFNQRFKTCISNTWCLIRILLLTKLLVSSEGITTHKNLYFHILLLCDSSLFFVLNE